MQVDDTHRGAQLLAALFSAMLSLDLYKDNPRIFLSVVSKAVMMEKLKHSAHLNKSTTMRMSQFHPNVRMTCLSEISLYDIITLKVAEGYVLQDKRLTQNLYKAKSQPILKHSTKILDISQFQQIQRHIPGYLSSNEWFLMYSPTRHGTHRASLTRQARPSRNCSAAPAT